MMTRLLSVTWTTFEKVSATQRRMFEESSRQSRMLYPKPAWTLIELSVFTNSRILRPFNLNGDRVRWSTQTVEFMAIRTLTFLLRDFAVEHDYQEAPRVLRDGISARTGNWPRTGTKKRLFKSPLLSSLGLSLPSTAHGEARHGEHANEYKLCCKVYGALTRYHYPVLPLKVACSLFSLRVSWFSDPILNGINRHPPHAAQLISS